MEKAYICHIANTNHEREEDGGRYADDQAVFRG